MNPPIIGQVKTVLIVGGKGIITSIHARTRGATKGEKIEFAGDVKIDSKILEHINTTLLEAVDSIISLLGHEPQNYNIVIKNIGATSVHDMGLEISGHSLDISLFLAVLSAGLQLPINQETVFTGGINSPDGYLLPVSGLPEKIKAAVEDKSLKHFVYASYDHDNSTKNLAPNEYKRIKQNLFDYKSVLKFISVDNIFETIKAVVSDENICIASLKSGFYSAEISVSLNQDPIGQTINYLLKDNDKRFWKTIEQSFLSANIDIAKEYIQIFAQHFFNQVTYPKNFGDKLLQLIISLPPAIKKKSGFYPLLEMKNYIRLGQYSKATDYDDIKKLFRAAFGDSIHMPRQTESIKIGEKTTLRESETVLEQFLRELSADNIAKEILLPIDNARASYTIDKVTIDNYEDFLDIITSFYAHVFRYMGQLSGDIDQKQVASHALDLVKRTFSQNGEEKAAYSEAKSGVNGGLRYIFDQMTERLKAEERSKYMKMILHSAIDPTDFNSKTVLIKTIMSQLGSTLPEKIKNQPPERFAADYDKIIEAYAQSREKLIEIIKIL